MSRVQQRFEAQKRTQQEALDNEKRSRKRMVEVIKEIPGQVERIETEEALARFRGWLAEQGGATA